MPRRISGSSTSRPGRTSSKQSARVSTTSHTAGPDRPGRSSKNFASGMTYRVDLATRAERDLIDLFQQINAFESIAAARWFNGLEEAIHSLESFPRRCPQAPESKKYRRPLRHLLYGSKPHIYRVIYEIDEP